MLGVVPSLLAVVCQRMQQLPTMLRPAVGIHINSCFLRVVSRASKPDGILACLQFGSPGQKYRIIILKEW